jgi:hypothetical protein
MSPNQERQAVEALAQALYEAEDPAGIAWVKRAQIVREPWIQRARQQLRTRETTHESE